MGWVGCRLFVSNDRTVGEILAKRSFWKDSVELKGARFGLPLKSSQKGKEDSQSAEKKVSSP